MTRISADSIEYEQMKAEHGGEYCRVFLDGMEIQHVSWFDVEEGCLERAFEDPEAPGYVVIDEDGDCIKTEILHGKVEIVWP